jgi:cytochrome c2
MHTPFWVKLGMAVGFSFLGLYGINLVGDMMGSSPGGHGESTHVASTEASDAAQTHGDPGLADPGHQDTTSENESHEGMSPADTGPADATPADVEATETVALVADVAAGAKLAKKKCGTCHTFNDGGGHRVGPNLWAIIDASQASKEGYRYSGALSGLGGTWTESELTAFLTSPKTYAKGTKMTFRGLNKEQEQADVVGYLKSLH